MTPKELLQKHNGDPLAAADALDAIGAGDETDPTLPLLNLYLAHRLGRATATKFTIARLGEDGAEKWGRALMGVLGHLSFVQYGFEELVGDEITRIANATDSERLAACIVALAEGE